MKVQKSFFKKVKKGLDFFIKGEYSINCSAVEPHGEAGMERVPCKLNNECKTKHQSSASEMALEERRRTGLSQLPVAEAKRRSYDK